MGRVQSTIPHQTSIVLDFVILVRPFYVFTPACASDPPWLESSAGEITATNSHAARVSG